MEPYVSPAVKQERICVGQLPLWVSIPSTAKPGGWVRGSQLPSRALICIHEAKETLPGAITPGWEGLGKATSTLS